MGNEDDNPTKTCWIQFLSPIYILLVSLNTEVFQNKVVRIISAVKPRNSAGPLYKALNIMKCEDINIQIKYGLPYCVTCPSMSTVPGIPPPGYSATPRTRVWGTGNRTHTGAGDTVWQPILNLYIDVFTFHSVKCFIQWSCTISRFDIRNNTHHFVLEND